MRFRLAFLFLFVLSACVSTKDIDKKDADRMRRFASEIDTEDLKEHLYLLSSDVLEGRKTGEKGQKMARNYLTAYYEHMELQAPQKYPEYRQSIPKEYFDKTSRNDSDNVLAYILGGEKPEEVVVISAHYDHLGIRGEEIYNGADDNASGTSALLEIAEAFMKAVKKGYRPKRSILFLHVTGEEAGLYGSKYYVSHPVFAMKNTVTNLNVDMIGRIDEKHKDKPAYIYLIGSDRMSKELHELSEGINKEFTNLKLDYALNKDSDPNRFYYRSDHYNFAMSGVPVIFYFNGQHEDYHKPTDTADKIDFELLKLRAEFIFFTAWELANRKERVVLDAE